MASHPSEENVVALQKHAMRSVLQRCTKHLLLAKHQVVHFYSLTTICPAFPNLHLSQSPDAENVSKNAKIKIDVTLQERLRKNRGCQLEQSKNLTLPEQIHVSSIVESVSHRFLIRTCILNDWPAQHDRLKAEFVLSAILK